MGAFTEILGIPFGFILTLLYDLTTNYGVALILFTLFSRLVMLPTSISQQKNTAKNQRLQPKLRRIQAKYAGNQQKIQEETQALYSREGHNPMNMGCAPMLIQFVIMFGLIGAIYYPLRYPLGIDETVIAALTEAATKLIGGDSSSATRTIQMYIIANIDKLKDMVPSLSVADYELISTFKFTFLGLPLGATPKLSWEALRTWNTAELKLWIVPITSFAATMGTSVFSYIKQRQNNPEMGKTPMMGCMSFGMPLMSLYFAFTFPIGIGIYWTAGSVFSMIQTVILSRTHSPQKVLARVMIEETIERRSREENVKKTVRMQQEA